MVFDAKTREIFMQNGTMLPSAQNRGTIMTMRVRKSDVDSFAKGKLSSDEFRKRASIASYTGNAGGGGFTSGVVRY
jgi:hypothetical protein